MFYLVCARTERTEDKDRVGRGIEGPRVDQPGCCVVNIPYSPARNMKPRALLFVAACGGGLGMVVVVVVVMEADRFPGLFLIRSHVVD